jgi:hypothetical protein
MSVSPSVLPPRLLAALDCGAPIDRVADAVLGDPLGAIEIAIASAAESGWADGLFGPGGFVLASSDDEGALMTGTVAAVPLQIAALVGLGPRPVADGADLALGDFSGFEDALGHGELPDAVGAVLAAPDRTHWSARASWLTSDGLAGREVVAIDGALAGLLLVTAVPGGDDTALVPCSSTDVWRALCALLPYPWELD